jgi:hypothetical protein
MGLPEVIRIGVIGLIGPMEGAAAVELVKRDGRVQVQV